MKRRYILLIATVMSVSIMGQDYSDALRYSFYLPQGTARSMSMGGAFGALGGDMSSFSINPAGIGVYRKSEFTLTPSYNYLTTKSDYNYSPNEEFVDNFNLTNAGFVSANNRGKNDGLVGINFGIAYNRLMNFNNNILISGDNTTNSYSEYFAGWAQGYQPSELDLYYEALAYDSYLIDTVGDLYTYADTVQIPVYQQRTIEASGGVGQWSFTLGLNFNHKLYLGIGFNLISFNYSNDEVHSEFDDWNLNEFNSFDYKTELRSSGIGYNFSLGIIVRPINYLRIGGAIQLPTRTKVYDEFYTRMYTYFDNGDSYYFKPEDEYGSERILGSKYIVRSPLKASLSAAFQLEKFGMISVEAEYIDYANMRLRNLKDNAYNIDDIVERNREISNTFASVINLKTGAEARLGKFYLRGGFAYYPSPYASKEINAKSHYINYTGGIGIRTKGFFIDIGGQYTTHEEKYNLGYSLPDGSFVDNIADLDENNIKIATTIGFRF